jgi:hypothetical protein
MGEDRADEARAATVAARAAAMGVEEQVAVRAAAERAAAAAWARAETADTAAMAAMASMEAARAEASRLAIVNATRVRIQEEIAARAAAAERAPAERAPAARRA